MWDLDEPENEPEETEEQEKDSVSFSILPETYEDASNMALERGFNSVEVLMKNTFDKYMRNYHALKKLRKENENGSNMEKVGI